MPVGENWPVGAAIIGFHNVQCLVRIASVKIYAETINDRFTLKFDFIHTQWGFVTQNNFITLYH